MQEGAHHTSTRKRIKGGFCSSPSFCCADTLRRGWSSLSAHCALSGRHLPLCSRCGRRALVSCRSTRHCPLDRPSAREHHVLVFLVPTHGREPVEVPRLVHTARSPTFHGDKGPKGKSVRQHCCFHANSSSPRTYPVEMVHGHG